MKSIKQYIALCICFLLCSTLIAQEHELTIQVKDAQNGDAIEYATVFITPCNCGGATDAKGNLKITLDQERYQIVTTSLGYVSDTTFHYLYEDRRLDINLKSEQYALTEVTVSAQGSQDNIERTEMGVQRINAKQLSLLPTAIGEIDALKGLVMMPGVGSAGEASNGISVRGGSLDQNLVLYENAPIFNPTHLFGLFSVFSPDAVSSVELFQANVPARFGGRIASVVDVKVKNPDPQDFKMTGGIGFVSSRIGIETPIIKNKLSVLASARVARNDFIFKLIDRLKNTKANFLDGTVKVNFTPTEKDNISWTGFYSEDFYQLDITSNINAITADANQYDYTTFNNTLNWLHSFDNDAYLRANFTTSKYDPEILFPQANKDNTIVYSSGIDQQTALVEFTKDVKEGLKVGIGGQGVITTISPGALDPGSEQSFEATAIQDENSRELSGFLDVEWKPNENLAVSGGLRYTQFALIGAYEEAQYGDSFLNERVSSVFFEDGDKVANYDGLEPRIGVRWKASELTSIKASYAQTYQYLQNIYNSATPLPTSRWKTSDRYIMPQRGTSYSAGIYQNTPSQNVGFSLEGYYKVIDNVIDYKPGADFFLQNYIEQDVLQGQGRAYGVELGLEKQGGKVNGWANYSWSRSLRKFDSEDIRSTINNNEWYSSDFDRPHVFNGTVNFTANEFNTFSFNFTYQTGRPYSIANAIFRVENATIPVFLERNNARLPAYHRLDFSWRLHNISTDTEKRWKGDWIFTIYNLYNRQNAYNWYYGGLNDSFSRNGVGAYQLSIFSNTMVSLAYTFVFE